MEMTSSPLVNLQHDKTFHIQMGGTLLGLLSRDLVKIILSFRPLPVGLVHTHYKHKSTFGVKGSCSVANPRSIVFPHDGAPGFIVLSSASERIDYFTEEGVLTKSIPLRERGHPRSLAIQENGNFVVTEASLPRPIKIVSPDGTIVMQTNNTAHPSGVAIDSLQRILVADDSVIRILDSDGNFLKTLENKEFRHPCDVAVGPDGNYVVVDEQQPAIVMYDSRDQVLRKWKIDRGCHNAVIDCVGNILVPCPQGHMTLYSPLGEVLKVWKNENRSMEVYYRVMKPMFVAVHRSGELYISDHENGRVVVWTPVLDQ